MAKKDADPVIDRAVKLFEKSGKSLDELGQAMGFKGEVARKAVWQLFNKVPDPRISTLRRFCAAMGITLAELFDEKPRKKKGG